MTAKIILFLTICPPIVFGGNSCSWTDPCSSPIATYFPDADTVAHVELKGATSGCRGQWNVCHFNWGIRGSSSSSISAEGTMQITKSSFARATAANLRSIKNFFGIKFLTFHSQKSQQKSRWQQVLVQSLLWPVWIYFPCRSWRKSSCFLVRLPLCLRYS